LKLLLLIRSHAKPTLTIGFVLCIISTVTVFFTLHRDLFPHFSFGTVTVSAAHPDYEPAEMVKHITRPLENQIGRIKGIKETLSLSSRGHMEILVKLDESRDKEETITDLKGQLHLPAVTLEIAESVAAVSPVMDMVFYSKANRFEDLRNHVLNIKALLENLPEVKRVKGIGVLSGETDKGGISVRYNRKPAMKLLVYKMKTADIIKAIRQINEEVADYTQAYPLAHEIVNDPEMVAQRLNLFLLAVIAALIVFALVGCLLFGFTAIGSCIAVLSAFSLSFTLLGSAGVRIDMLTSLILFLMTGFIFALAAMLTGRVSTHGVKGLADQFFPVTCVVIAILITVGILSHKDTDLVNLFRFIQLSVAIPALVAPAVFFLFLPAFTVLPGGKKRRAGKLYRAAIETVLSRKLFSNLAVFLPVAITLWIVIKAFSGDAFVLYPETESPKVFVNLTGLKHSNLLSNVEKIEERVSSLSGVKNVSAYIGIESASDDFLLKRGDRFAQVLITHEKSTDKDAVLPVVKALVYEKGVSVEVLKEEVRDEQPIQIGVSGKSLSGMIEIADRFQKKLSQVEGIHNISVENEPDQIYRRNKERLVTIGAGHDPQTVAWSEVYQDLNSMSKEFPDYTITIENHADQLLKDGKPLLKGIYIATGLLLVLHIVMAVYLRSLLHFIIPFSFLYVFAGALLLMDTFSTVTFICSFGLLAILSLDLLSFLQMVRKTDLPQSDTQSVVLACASEKLDSTVLAFCCLLSAGIVPLLGDPVIRSMGLSFSGGLVFLLYFQTIALPVLVKKGLDRKQRRAEKKAAEPIF